MDLATGADAPGCHSAQAVIDMAIICQAKNQPLYELLGNAYRNGLENDLTPVSKRNEHPR